MVEPKDPYYQLFNFIKRYRLVVLPLCLAGTTLLFEYLILDGPGNEFQMFRYVGF